MTRETSMTSTSTIDLSPDQEKAVLLALEWFQSTDRKPIFRIFGYAGTGKTTITKEMIRRLQLFDETIHRETFIEEEEDFEKEPAEVLYAAYTGKAALVMTKHGTPARTIHSLIYKLCDIPEEEIRKVELELDSTDDPAKRKELLAKKRELTAPRFELNVKSDLARAHLLVLDECSMVDDDMLRDIFYFKVPLLVLGDPGQLPPINGTGALIKDAPDVLLTEIHRQAKDNPIIGFATRARNDITIPFTDGDPRARHLHKWDFTSELAMSVDQILVGKNTTRKMMNTRMREVLGRESHLPAVGDKLICLRNDAGMHLFNGLMAEVVEVGDILDASIDLMIRTEIANPDDEPLKVTVLRAHFEAYINKDALDNVKWWDRRGCQEFDYGYAITVHKSQGSQWDNVLIYDDKFLAWKRKERTRWLYTAITRAAERLTIIS